MRAKLTKENITELASEKVNKIVWDSTVVGMGIRMRASGHMTYVVQYRLGTGRHSKSVRVTLDDVASVNLDDARKAAKAILGSVALGNDPRQGRKAEAIALDRLVASVINEYDRDFEMRMVSPHHRSNTISILRRGLAKYLARDLGELVLRDFIRAIQEAGRPGSQQGLRQRITPFLNFARNAGIIPVNVMAGWRRPRSSRAAMLARPGRILSKEELVAIWKATANAGSFNGFVRFMMLTGVRNCEAACLDWSWIEETKAAIIIPANRMKSGRSHSIPITVELLTLLNDQPRLNSCNLVFPTRSIHGGWTKMSGFGQMVDKLKRRSCTADWTLYDIRRTYRSILADLGFDLDLCERMIAHNRGGLVERYDRSTRWAARSDAAGVISKYILGIEGRSEEQLVKHNSVLTTIGN